MDFGFYGEGIKKAPPLLIRLAKQRGILKLLMGRVQILNNFGKRILPNDFPSRYSNQLTIYPYPLLFCAGISNKKYMYNLDPHLDL